MAMAIDNQGQIPKLRLFQFCTYKTTSAALPKPNLQHKRNVKLSHIMRFVYNSCVLFMLPIFWFC